MKYLYFLLIAVFLLPGCSKKNDKQYMKEAEDSLRVAKYEGAVKIYEKVAADFAESQSAPEALFQLGFIYQNRLLKNVTENQSLEKSIGYYRQVADKYPKYDKAPDALFTAGFLLSNDLKKYSDATAVYNKLINDYPKSNWTPQAKEELDNMGLTPEQILNKKIKTKK